jgi:hypothetical protein
MDAWQWRELLTQWSKDVLASSHRQDLSSEVIASGWLEYPPATEDQIIQAETRLKTRLPSSYREFLKVSNGWHKPSILINHLSPVEEIDWFVTRYRDWFNDWMVGRQYGQDLYESLDPVPDEEYFVYGEEQNPLTFREEFFQTALAISDAGNTAIYLLNPQIRTAEGEWEAWFFEMEIGVVRYRSFWELMRDEYENFLRLRDI